MDRLNVILILSVIILLLPFLGLPQAFDNFLYTIFGLVIFVIAYLMKRDSNGRELYSKREENNNGEGI